MQTLERNTLKDFIKWYMSERFRKETLKLKELDANFAYLACTVKITWARYRTPVYELVNEKQNCQLLWVLVQIIYHFFEYFCPNLIPNRRQWCSNPTWTWQTCCFSCLNPIQLNLCGVLRPQKPFKKFPSETCRLKVQLCLFSPKFDLGDWTLFKPGHDLLRQEITDFWDVEFWGIRELGCWMQRVGGGG